MTGAEGWCHSGCPLIKSGGSSLLNMPAGGVHHCARCLVPPLTQLVLSGRRRAPSSYRNEWRLLQRVLSWRGEVERLRRCLET